MRAVDAYADLRRFRRPIVTTEDAAVRLRTSLSATSRILARLVAAGLLKKLRRGLWVIGHEIDPLIVPEYLTAPLPAYVSFQSALYYHGIIEQIPRVIYVATLGPSRRISTSIGTYSIHRLAPEFFGGFVVREGSDIHLASPEKALLDVFYLSNTRNRLFASLPEIEVPPHFNVREARRWIARIRGAARRTQVRQRLDAALMWRRPVRPRPGSAVPVERES